MCGDGGDIVWGRWGHCVGTVGTGTRVTRCILICYGGENFYLLLSMFIETIMRWFVPDGNHRINPIRVMVGWFLMTSEPLPLKGRTGRANDRYAKGTNGGLLYELLPVRG